MLRVVVLVDHQVLQHRVFILDLIVDLLVKVAHRIVRVLAHGVLITLRVFTVKKDVTEARLIAMLASSKHDSDSFVLI